MRKIVLVLFLSFIIYSCKTNQEEQKQLPERKIIEEKMIGTNILMLEIEDQEISDFVERHGWNVEKTGSGLRYEIFYKGEGERAEVGAIATIHYEIRLLTGDLVYSSKDDGVKSFRIGRSGVESGLDEGILMMNIGDKARFIMPPHLAHGVPGDGVKIPKRVPIVYVVELVNLK